MKGIRIRPEHDGLRSSLFDLEAEIMEIVWTRRWDEFSVNDVHEALAKQRDAVAKASSSRSQELAYTTVMTTVARLFDKELLVRRKDGRRYLYRPAMSQSDFVQSMTREVLASLPPLSKDAAMALLVERVAEADDDELERLEAVIRERRRGQHG
ncbi:MAG: BlaI/MecI/CopY family transcriptional regulator [Myxococcota bacterium]|nr:BlaI/MecI/CopY family transcriptional regulator [Myxococcota bacterium]